MSSKREFRYELGMYIIFIEYILATISLESAEILVGVFYVPPSVVSQCKDFLTLLFSQYCLSYDDVILVGDFNMNHLNTDRHDINAIISPLNLIISHPC